MNNSQERGPLLLKSTVYGTSAAGRDLEVFLPPEQQSQLLLIGSIHGDESIGTVLLSEALRCIPNTNQKAAVILAANPDGVLNGTRCNQNGVDLNRNYPTQNWQSDPVYYRNRPGDPQNIPLSPGRAAGSEPETRALIQLIEALCPLMVVTLHGYLACIDDPDGSVVAQDIARRTQMELVADVGYATPGSFGSWCAEQGLLVITYELPSLGMSALRQIHLPVLLDLLTGQYDAMIRKS